ncbi:YceI family protein [Telluribacter sp. SYSU D00476]|uniref:YceI family protein n=1 Tax=Telluribacter sp. SYSU D00476 TaxID=2811430 RepID=UPI001FF27CD3|nr:YceI family protein [Telluribacter sp. SYSU D00476]
MIRLLPLGLLCLLCAFTPVTVTTWSVKSYSVKCKIRNAGIPVTATFTDLQANLRFDPSRPTESTLTASLGANTIKTGVSLRDYQLRSRNYLYADKYPRLLMQSKQIRAVGKNSYVGQFDLTLRGVTKVVEVPFSFVQQGNLVTCKGKFSINRRDFGVGGSSLILDDKVDIVVEVTGSDSSKEPGPPTALPKT